MDLILSKDNYISIERNLIQNLESAIITQAKALQISSAMQVSSFIDAHINININIWAVGCASWNGYLFCSNSAVPGACDWGNAFHNVEYSTSQQMRRAICDIPEEVRKFIDNTALKAAINHYDNNKRYSLKYLYFLSYIAREEFQSNFFLKYYEASMKGWNFANDRQFFERSKKEMIDIIASKIRESSDELDPNIFLASLKRIIKVLAD